MKQVSRKQVRIISEATAPGFQSALNDTIAELAKDNIKYDLQFPQGSLFVAYIVYEETANIPETLADEFELKGETCTCSDCPFYAEIKSKDRRVKNTPCKHINSNYAYKDRRACEWFYQQLKGNDES